MMSASISRKDVLSLQALRRKLAAETLARLQPILLLQVFVGLSQSLSGSVVQSEALARTLLLDGQQRLRRLLSAAPRLNLPLDRVLEIVRTESDDKTNTAEENAVQALLEMCLGLMLRWLSQGRHSSHAPSLLIKWQRVLSQAPLSLSCCYPPGKRVCPPHILPAFTG